MLTQQEIDQIVNASREADEGPTQLVRRAVSAARVRCAVTVSMLFDEVHVAAGKHRSSYDEGRLDALDIAEERIRVDYPECSGNPDDCPENEGYGCCNRGA